MARHAESRAQARGASPPAGAEQTRRRTLHRPRIIVMGLVALSLSACDTDPMANGVGRAKGVNVIDESDLNGIMLTVGDPAAAVAHFRRTLSENPDRIDLRRGLALSLTRADDAPGAAVAWGKVVEHAESTPTDGVKLAEALIRAGDWKGARTALDAVPPTYESYDRYRLEAMAADMGEQWSRSDAFYENAVELTERPAKTLNNWGYSKLSRGEYRAAEDLFTRALREDPGMFTAKNNLVLARAAQGIYDMPLVDMTQIERAQLLHTSALAAIKRGDIRTGRVLLEDAIETHPQHFEAAVRALETLDSGR